MRNWMSTEVQQLEQRLKTLEKRLVSLLMHHQHLTGILMLQHDMSFDN